MNFFEEYLSCPNCKAEFKYYNVDSLESSDGILICQKCDGLFPVRSGIPVLFKDEVRNTNLEITMLEDIVNGMDAQLRGRIIDEKNRLSKLKFCTTWEWEDVKYWDKVYREKWEEMNDNVGPFDDSTYPIRVLQREPEIKMMCQDNFIPTGIILEVGAGTATYSRNIVNIKKDFIYAAVDMSLYALMIRRKLTDRPNSLFLMASVDNLPFKDKCVSAMLLIGILHHSERKEETIPDLKKLMVPGGIIYLNEALSRPSFLSHRNIVKGIDVSLHEETINYNLLMEILGRFGHIDYHIIFNTPFYQFASRYFMSLVIVNRLFYKIFRVIDDIARMSLGMLLPSFKAGEVSIIWRNQ